jgi:hypothetical protein
VGSSDKANTSRTVIDSVLTACSTDGRNTGCSMCSYLNRARKNGNPGIPVAGLMQTVSLCRFLLVNSKIGIRTHPRLMGFT